MEPRISQTLGQCSATETHPLPRRANVKMPHKYSRRVANGAVRLWVWQAKVSSGLKAINQQWE